MKSYRKCTKCGKRKSLENFHKSSREPLGVRQRCRICVSVASKVYSKMYYDKHKTALLAKTSRWRKKNKARDLKRNREWKKNNKAKVQVLCAKRRALHSLAAINDFTADQWLALKRAYLYRCHYCKKRKRLTQDHVIPLSKGGNHTLSNIVPACQPCNSRKRDRCLTELQW